MKRRSKTKARPKVDPILSRLAALEQFQRDQLAIRRVAAEISAAAERVELAQQRRVEADRQYRALLKRLVGEPTSWTLPANWVVSDDTSTSSLR